MVQQIEDLLNHASPALDSVEDTLTEGYAKALALESQRLKLERRLGEVARRATPERAAEIRSLGSQLIDADGELEQLCSLLGTLHDRARELRAATA
jgi:hypothetical protein